MNKHIKNLQALQHCGCIIMNDKNIVLFFIGIALSTAIGLAHSLSYQDAIADQQAYCTNVEQGTWPDYKKNFENVCK